MIQVLKRVSSPPRSFQSRCVPSACCISCPDSDICLRVKRSQGCLGVNQLVSELKNDSSFSHFFGPNSTFNFYKSRSSVIVCESHSLPRTLNYNTLLYWHLVQLLFLIFYFGLKPCHFGEARINWWNHTEKKPNDLVYPVAEFRLSLVRRHYQGNLLMLLQWLLDSWILL